MWRLQIISKLLSEITPDWEKAAGKRAEDKDQSHVFDKHVSQIKTQIKGNSSLGGKES